MHLNFLESIGALTIVCVALYLLFSHWDNQDKDIAFLRDLLKKDFIVREEFKKYLEVKYKYDTSEYTYNKALKEFFTDEKLKEVAKRLEEKESTPS